MIPLAWRKYKERYRLIGNKCDVCGEKFFPQRMVCPKCRSKGRLSEIKYSGKGKVISYSKIRSPPKGFEEYKPYYVGIIELEEGPRIFSQIVDVDSVQIGMPVKMIFRRLSENRETGLIHYGFKFTKDTGQ